MAASLINNSKLDQTRNLPNRIDKTLDWLEKSRDAWKDKCLAAKLSLKKKTLASKRIRLGRDEWKQKALDAQTKIKEISCERNAFYKEIVKLKSILVEQQRVIDELKKKSSSRAKT